MIPPHTYSAMLTSDPLPHIATWAQYSGYRTFPSPSLDFPSTSTTACAPSHPSATGPSRPNKNRRDDEDRQTPRGFNTTPSKDSLRSLNVKRLSRSRARASIHMVTPNTFQTCSRLGTNAFLIVMTKRRGSGITAKLGPHAYGRRPQVKLDLVY